MCVLIDKSEEIYMIMKPKEFAEKVGVCVKTLQRWDREGILPAKRTPTDRRYYTEEDILKVLEGGDA